MAEGQDDLVIIGPNATVKGDITVESRLRINGRFEGKVNAHGGVEIGDKGSCKAEFDVSSIQVGGEVEGDIKAKDLVTLAPTANVKGNLQARKLTIAEGASLDGHVSIGQKGNQGGQGQAGGQKK